MERQAIVRQNMKNFLGKPRDAGAVITAEELALLTPQTMTALVNQGIIEVEGMGPAGGAGMSAADHEALSALGARFDAYREETGKQFSALNLKIDALLAANGSKASAKRAKKG